MKFGLYGLHRDSVDPATVAARARQAEAAGFESLWVGDHIALPAADATGTRLEAVVAVTYLAAMTTRIRVGIGLIVLPQRQPVLLAKQLTSLDLLSAGRLTVGVGVGYVQPELHALGVPLAERAARTEEYLAVMRALWAGAPSYTGQFVSFDGVLQRPGPVQLPHPPIVVGGHSPAAYRRAVRHGNGWYGWELDPAGTAEALGALAAAGRETERPAGLGELEITMTPPRGPVDQDLVRRYADLGVHRLILQPGSDADTEALIDTVGATLI
ncbi:MAG TPA: TIGR03619 family F420-dependent LLM class oxidoreductase [Mycobacteriales bacterium]|nr:TIGR03619 family F420-dependent LLM class oxidoreductase [Mycobacteriales bacterium]